MTLEFIEIRIKEQVEYYYKIGAEIKQLEGVDDTKADRRIIQYNSAVSQLNYFKEQKVAICGWQ